MLARGDEWRAVLARGDEWRAVLARGDEWRPVPAARCLSDEPAGQGRPPFRQWARYPISARRLSVLGQQQVRRRT
ncbi:hypothetical protein, partial [Actinoplanes utahensis]|uniref:hypothetical protein n=1 Tax=Actinoplanes utahensis TaxID=1869 RepID=UPI001F1FD785